MNTPGVAFALCHGWGFDARSMARFEQALRLAFPAATVVVFDIGFTGCHEKPNLIAGKQWIAVGHSYGLSYLMQKATKWHAAIALNGFTYFCGQEGRPEGVPIHTVNEMLASLVQAPRVVLNRFYQSCNSPWPVPQKLDVDALHEHLTRLRDLNMEPAACQILSFICSDDEVVPPAVSRASFLPSVVATHEFPGHHLSLLLEPEKCIGQISSFIKELDD